MNLSRRSFAALAGAAALSAGPALAAKRPRVLVFHKATGFVHPSIKTGAAMLTAIGARDGYNIEITDDPEIFAGGNLTPFDAIVLLCCTTDSQNQQSEWLVGPRRDGLQAFVRSSKGVVGIHAAADSHHFWPYYGQMLGGYFDRHRANPNVRPGRLIVVDRNDPSTRGLPAVIERRDEWYLFRDFNPLVHMLIAAEVGAVYVEGVDPLPTEWFTSQTNKNMKTPLPEVNPKPIAWRHEFESSRVFYTAMGHVPESFTDEPLVNRHISGGLRWALRRVNARG